jgi:hypothetical protein
VKQGLKGEARLGVSVYMAMHDAIERGLNSLVKHLEDDIASYEQCRSTFGLSATGVCDKVWGGEARLGG